MRTVTVNVTQEDIDRGRRGSCGRCPVARAIRRDARLTNILVDPFYVVVGLATPAFFTVHLPRIARRFIEAFDAGRPVRPIAFPLRVPVTTEAR
jgi:hypothetical protein